MSQHYEGEAITQRDRQLSLWSAASTGMFLILWTVWASDAGRYVLYALPITLVGLHILFLNFQLRIDLRMIVAVAIYLIVAGISVVHADTLNQYTSRDLIVISAYFLLFAFVMRPIPAAIDILSLCLVCALAIEGVRQGVSLSVTMLGSQGILESGLAFPLGVVVLYNVFERRWWPTIIMGVFFFAAYKRIAILGVIAIVGSAAIVKVLRLQRYETCIAVTIVILCSMLSLFSMQLFGWVASLAAAEDTSADSLSLGRFELIRVLWRGVYATDWTNVVFGHGPGSADDAIAAAIPGAANPHNDWMKIFYDYGVIGTVAIHVVLFLILARAPFARWLYLYAAILMTTDNTFIYLYHQCVVYLVLYTRSASSHSYDITASHPHANDTITAFSRKF